MKVSHVISSIDNAMGGPSRSVTQLLENMGRVDSDMHLNLYTAHTLNPIILDFEKNNLSLEFYHARSLGFLSGLQKGLAKSEADIYHGQAIWDLPIHQMAKLARSKGIPYIITPRGMLEPWSLKQKTIKKKLALAFYQFKDLKGASCLHATAKMEANNLRKLGLKNPIAIIPNGIQLENLPLKEYENKENAQKKILFLSRIHKKKGIEFLIQAWAQLEDSVKKEWTIDIIGNGDTDYIDTLKKEILIKGFENEIIIKGPIYGVEKSRAYQEADLFVLPSYSENFGIVVAEALSSGTPVITTKGTPWEDLESSKCGWHIEIGLLPLVTAMKGAMTISNYERQLMGQNGRKLVEEKYSMEEVAKQMLALYEWIVNKKQRPDFVRLD